MTTWVSTLLQKWLGRDATTPVEFDPVFPAVLIWLGAGVLLIVVLCTAWRERRTMSRPQWLPVWVLLRLLAVLGLVLALLNPSAVKRLETKNRHHLTVAVDTSASMSLKRPMDAATSVRWQTAAADQASAPFDLTMAHAVAVKLQLAQADAALTAETFDRHWKAATTAAEQVESSATEAASALPSFQTRITPWLSEWQRCLPPTLALPADRRRQALASTRSQLAALIDQGSLLATEAAASLRGLVEPAPQNRLPAITSWLDAAENSWLKELSEDASIERFTFAESVAAHNGPWADAVVQTDSDTAVTDLQAVLKELAAQATRRQLDAAIIVTDGLHTANIDDVTIPPALSSTPLLIVPVGSEIVKNKDLFLRQLDAPTRVMLEDQIVVRALVSGTELKGQTALVDLLENNQVITTAEVPLTSDKHFQYAELKYQAQKPGLHELRVRIRPIQGEISADNNERPLRLNVVESQVNVFIVDGSPRWETRYLLNLFRREKQSAASGLLFTPQHKFPGTGEPQPKTLPYSLAAWQTFQVVILGDLSPNQLTAKHIEILNQYVEAGGHLIVCSGREHMPQAFVGTALSKMLPVEIHPKESGSPMTTHVGWQVALTAEGLSSDALRLTSDDPGSSTTTEAALWQTVYSQLPVQDLNRWCRPKPAARVLLECRDVRTTPTAAANASLIPRAYLATHVYGQGSVTYFASPSTWHLRVARGDRYHYQFWGQLTRALVSGEFTSAKSGITIEAEKYSYGPEEPVSVSLRLRESNGQGTVRAEVSVMARQGEKIIGTAPAKPDPAQPGRFTATFAQLSASGPVELVPIGTDVDRLQKERETPLPIASVIVTSAATTAESTPPSEPAAFFAEASRSPMAALVAPSALPTALKHLPLSSTTQVVLEKTPLWPQWSLLWILIILLAVEWTGRKLTGLI